MLQISRVWRQYPVARLASDQVSNLRKRSNDRRDGIGSGRRTESLVAPSLMRVQEVPNRVVLGFLRQTTGTAIVGERKQHRGPAVSTPLGQPLDPVLRDQVEQGRSGHQVTTLKKVRGIERAELEAACFEKAVGHRRPHLRQK